MLGSDRSDRNIFHVNVHEFHCHSASCKALIQRYFLSVSHFVYPHSKPVIYVEGISYHLHRLGVFKTRDI